MFWPRQIQTRSLFWCSFDLVPGNVGQSNIDHTLQYCSHTPFFLVYEAGGDCTTWHHQFLTELFTGHWYFFSRENLDTQNKLCDLLINKQELCQISTSLYHYDFGLSILPQSTSFFGTVVSNTDCYSGCSMHAYTGLKSTVRSWDSRISCVTPGVQQTKIQFLLPLKCLQKRILAHFLDAIRTNHEREVATKMGEAEKNLVKL